jgi:hypothetical protein
MGDNLLRETIAAMSQERQEAIRQRSLELLRAWGTIDLPEATTTGQPSDEASPEEQADVLQVEVAQAEPTEDAESDRNEALAALVRAVQEAIEMRHLARRAGENTHPETSAAAVSGTA